jgi:diadenosine tetraphosphate (Ap4A) HIT family hydrolase
VTAQEIKQALSLTASRSQMNIGYEESAKSPGSFHAHHVARVRWVCLPIRPGSRLISQRYDDRD